MLTIQPREHENPEIGCLHALIAYCLTAYLFMGTIDVPGDAAQSWYWIPLAPLLFPLLMFVGLIAGGNSEVPVSAVGVIGMMFLFLIALGFMLLLLQQALKRHWLAWTMSGAWVTYMLYAIVKSI
jgi:hypothetical protein